MENGYFFKCPMRRHILIVLAIHRLLSRLHFQVRKKAPWKATIKGRSQRFRSLGQSELNAQSALAVQPTCRRSAFLRQTIVEKNSPRKRRSVYELHLKMRTTRRSD